MLIQHRFLALTLIGAALFSGPRLSALDLEQQVTHHGVRIDQLENRVTHLERAPSSTRSQIPPASSSAAATPGTHIVQSGESLWSIAQDHGTTVSRLKRDNSLKSNILRSGQTLKVPASGSSAAATSNAKTTRPSPSEPVIHEETAVRESPPPATGSGQTHTIKSGETLGKIATRYGVTVADLQKANGLSSPNRIRAGQDLVIPGAGSVSPQPVAKKAPEPTERSAPSQPTPAPIKPVAPVSSGTAGTHTLAPGETLYGLSRRYGVPLKELMARNNIKDAKSLREGMKLSIPGAGSSAPASTANVPASAEKITAPATGKGPSPSPASASPATNSVESAPAVKTVTYLVGADETARSISSSFGLTVTHLLQLNGLSSENQITPGQKIKVPAAAVESSLGSPF